MADYSIISITYDDARDLSNQNIELWINLLSNQVGSRKTVDFLDLGCGTGRFSIPIADKLGFSVTGVDNSKEMLLKAKEKSGKLQIKWDLENAGSLSYADKSFDVVFISHLLHHVENPRKVLEECYRVLRTGGLVINRYGAMENIMDDPEHQFFPETIEIDKTRTPSVEQVENWLRKAGFTNISSKCIIQQTYKTGKERLEKMRLKATSVLTLISKESFNLGLNHLEQYVADHPDHEWILTDKLTMTTGIKNVIQIRACAPNIKVIL